jgi:protein farnesyltransferase subunit beta
LKKCQHPTGGFGGGPYQQAHLAPTYGAVNSLCIIGTEEAYNAVDRLVVKLDAAFCPCWSIELHLGHHTEKMLFCPKNFKFSP